MWNRPMPTGLLKGCIDIVAPIIMEIINLSLTTQIMPNQMQEALICPLLKTDLDSLQFKNYRPISNLAFISKLIEHAVCDQLMDHAYKTGNLERLQSAYHSNHSTETALLKIKADILDNMDNQRVTGILLLDLSAAFDTVSKNLLINHLFYRFGVCDQALGWMENYLLDHTQKVKIGNTESTPAVLTQGVPQGSVLGPILYTLFTSPVGDLCKEHGINYHGYADDTQNYHSFAPNVPGDQQKCINILESCVSDIRIWMCTNQLKLNDDKTEFILIGTRQQLAKVSRNIAIRVGPDLIPVTESAKNPGYHLDSTLRNATHINKLCSSLSLTIRRICKIRPNIDEETTRTLVWALITSRLDYCNSLFIGTPDYILHKLQCIQNSAARLVFNKKWVYHITPYSESLHWLKIEYCIQYKICMLMFKCVKGLPQQQFQISWTKAMEYAARWPTYWEWSHDI